MKKAIPMMLVLMLMLSACGTTVPEAEDETIFTEDVTETAAASIPPETILPTIPEPEETEPEFTEAAAEAAVRSAPQDIIIADSIPAVQPEVPQFSETPTENLEPSQEETVPTPEPAEPAQTEPTISVPTEPDPTESEPAPTVPAVCQHQWVPVQNIPAEYDCRYFVICSCGAEFADADSWTVHRDSYLGTEDLLNHTGYGSGSEKTEISPAMTVWQCSLCGISKTVNSLEAP